MHKRRNEKAEAKGLLRKLINERAKISDPAMRAKLFHEIEGARKKYGINAKFLDRL